MDDRQKAIIERIIKDLKLEGFDEINISEKLKNGYGDYSSYFQVLVDCKLDGVSFPTSQEVFDNMKKQINYASSTISEVEKAFRNQTMKIKELEDIISGKNDEIKILKEIVSKSDIS